MSVPQTTITAALTRLLCAAEKVIEIEAGYEFEFSAAVELARDVLNRAAKGRSADFRNLLRQVSARSRVC